jgi:hypothetical protein
LHAERFDAGAFPKSAFYVLEKLRFEFLPTETGAFVFAPNGRKKLSDRLLLLSNVEPRVTTVPGSLIWSLRERLDAGLS